MEQLYKEHIDSENTEYVPTATSILNVLGEKRRQRQNKTVFAIDFMHSSRKAWQTLNRLTEEIHNLGLLGYKVKRHFFRHGRRIAPKFCTHVRVETRLALSFKKMDPPHPIPIETRLYRRPSGRRPSEGCRPSAVDTSAMRRVASLFGEVLLYQHQRIITMTKGYIASNNLPVEIIRFHTIIRRL